MGSIIKVKNAMAAAGKPKPRKPFTIPEIKNIVIKKRTIGRSVVGKRYENVVFTIVSFKSRSWAKLLFGD